MSKDTGSSKTVIKIPIFGIIIFTVAVVVATISVHNKFLQFKNNSSEAVVEETEEPAVETISESYLEEILYMSDLSTIDYAYSAVATAYAEDGETVMYYVAYDGTVTAGLDFNEIEVDVDNDNMIITITLPECEIQNITVEFESMEYIFTADKYETETVSTDAYALCEQDLNERASKEEHILDTAQESAVAAVEALMRSWIEQAYQDYDLYIL